ncbi:membrane protein of unknown function [Peptococcaceae bacterium CEB3]|nr:membrane protein of unknown function [Peptococcaceae bacterium CEB3]
MFGLLARWLINSVALLLTTLFVPGLHLSRPSTAVWAALVWGLANTLIRPVLSFFTFPLQIVTLGLFTLVINALMLLLTARLVPGFSVRGFGSALLGSIVLSVISVILTHMFA